MFQVFFPRVTVDKDVVHVRDNKFVKLLFKCFVHKQHECCRGFGDAEGQYMILEVSVRVMKCC